MQPNGCRQVRPDCRVEVRSIGRTSLVGAGALKSAIGPVKLIRMPLQ